ncbi:MAG: prolyl oligopeptidase family serine peptidase [Phycisphaerae bacterium]|jgi:prolyl oligopeptidase
MRLLGALTGIVGFAVVVPSCGPYAVTKFPVAGKQPVTNTYHGVRVVDAYQWLENWDDPKVQNWSDGQNRHARAMLEDLPHVSDIRERVAEIMKAKTVSYYGLAHRGGTLFAMKYEPPKNKAFLIALRSANEPDTARVLVDPNVIDPKGLTGIDWYVASPDGRHVAVSLSKAGTESGDVHVHETGTGEQVYEVIPRVNGGTAGGDLAWAPDGSGFFYTRYPRTGERSDEDMNFYQQVYYHELGTPTEQDRYELGEGLPRIAEIQLAMDVPSGRLLATVQDGDGGEFAHFLRSTDGSWMQFSEFGDRTIQAVFGVSDDLFLLTRWDAPKGKILRAPIAELNNGTPETVIPEGDDTIVSSFMESPSILATDSRLYVTYQLGGPSEIRVFGHQGQGVAKPEQLPVSSVGGLTKLTGDDILFNNRSFIDPPAWYHYAARGNRTTKTKLASVSPVDFSDVKVVREFATSKDGTKVPVNIMMRKGTKLDGSNPCVVSGYGGYGVSLSPRFSSTRRVTLDQGVIFAVANLRGGGEYGEAWHLSGNLTNKQNVFDDFAAVLQHMIDRGYTNPDKLAIIGGSNGGLLMGAAMVQHPDLMKAVVSFVGIYDMLRVELSPNGQFNIPEFGTVENRDHFEALYAYSPYHNVRDGVAYPATLFLTGANDPRVDPMQSRKMTARLQEATGSSAPILLRTSSESGHGGGPRLEERITQTAQVYAFIFDQLGVAFRPPT